LALSGCTNGQTPLSSSEAPLSPAATSIGQRDLTPEEKKVIMGAVGPSLRNPGSAKYHWAQFPAVVTEEHDRHGGMDRRSLGQLGAPQSGGYAACNGAHRRGRGVER
jgi:hypothetical protein